jgi:CheY-like chemotaxis protein
MQTHGQGKHILVVDDEELGRTATRLFLRSAGYAVEAATCAEEALERLDNEHYDLVITDNQMPEMSGLELASAIKTRWPRLPIVMFSAHPPEGPIASLDLILRKPDDVPNLRQSVRQILDRTAQ